MSIINDLANSNQTTEIKPEKVVSLFPANLVRIFFIYGCLYRERHVHFATSDSGCKVFSKAGGFLQRMYVAGDFTLFICSCMFCFPTLPKFSYPRSVHCFSRICCLGQRFSKPSSNSTKVQSHKVKLASWTTPKMLRFRHKTWLETWGVARRFKKNNEEKPSKFGNIKGKRVFFFCWNNKKKGNKNKEKDHWILWKKGGLRGEIWDVFEAPKGFMYTLAVQSLRAERRLVDDDVNSLQQHVFLCQRASGDHISHVKSHVF